MDSNQSDRQQMSEYINNLLASYAPAADLLPVTQDNCIEALHDGVILCYVVNCISTVGPIIKQSELKRTKATLFHKMDQVNQALEAAKKVGLNLVNIRAEFIVEKKENTIIGLFNQIKRQKPGPKTEKKVEPKPQPVEKKVEPVEYKIESVPKKPEVHNEQPQPKRQSESNFVLNQENPPVRLSQPHHHPVPVQQQQPVAQQQKPAQNPKQAIASMQINQHQVISNEAQKGYHFEEVVGMQIVVLGGSLRKGSVNYGIVKALEQIKSKKYFENVYFHVPDLSILPLLNYDLVKEGKIPKAVYDLRAIISKSLGVLIATPEYNGTFSSIIKNAFDWLSDSWPDNVSPLVNKKIGIVSSSYLTQNQIRDTIEMGEYLKCNYFPYPFYINLRSGAFNMETGQLTSPQELDRLALWYQDYSYFVISGKPHPDPPVRFIMNL